MAKKYSGGIQIPTPFKQLIDQPIVDYMVVEFLSDLTDLSELPNQFRGMLTHVLEDDSWYGRIGEGWVKFSTGELSVPTWAETMLEDNTWNSNDGTSIIMMNVNGEFPGIYSKAVNQIDENRYTELRQTKNSIAIFNRNSQGLEIGTDGDNYDFISVGGEISVFKGMQYAQNYGGQMTDQSIPDIRKVNNLISDQVSAIGLQDILEIDATSIDFGATFSTLDESSYTDINHIGVQIYSGATDNPVGNYSYDTFSVGGDQYSLTARKDPENDYYEIVLKDGLSNSYIGPGYIKAVGPNNEFSTISTSGFTRDLSSIGGGTSQFNVPAVNTNDIRYLGTSISLNGDTPILFDESGNIDLIVSGGSTPTAQEVFEQPYDDPDFAVNVDKDIVIQSTSGSNYDRITLQSSELGTFIESNTRVALETTNHSISVSPSRTQMFANAGTLELNVSGTGEMFVVGVPGTFQGMKYQHNYSTNYVNRSLVDKEYVDGLVAAVFRPAGNYDASVGTFPITGTGTSGVIRRGDTYKISVAGTIGGETYDIGDNFYAVINSPGQTSTNWARFEANTNQATSSYRGTVRLYNTTGTNTDGGVDQNTVTTRLATKANLIGGNTFTGTQIFPSGSIQITGANGIPFYTSGNEGWITNGSTGDYLKWDASGTPIFSSLTTDVRAVTSGTITPVNSVITSGQTWSQQMSRAQGQINALIPLSASSTLDFPSTASGTSSDLTITVTGAVVGKPVRLGVPAGSVLSNSSYSAWVSAADTVTVRLNNYSSTSKDPVSGSFTVEVSK